MTGDIQDGMAFAMSVWASDDLDWLQHGTCSGTCGIPDLKFKNFVFTTANGDGASNNGGSDGNNGESSGGDNSSN